MGRAKYPEGGITFHPLIQMTWRRRQQLEGAAFLAPGLAFFILVMAGPAMAGLLLGFFKATPTSREWCGLANYAGLLHDKLFLQAARNTARFVGFLVPAGTLLPLGLALLIYPLKPRLRAFFRGVFYLPVMVSGPVMVSTFLFLAEPHYGLLNYLLRTAGLDPVSWLGDRRFAWLFLCGIALFGGLGTDLIIFLVGLDAVPQELVDAAEMDGAGWWAQIRHIRLPLLRPMMLFVVLTNTTGALMMWDLPLMYSFGGPLNSTMTPAYLLYIRAFGSAEYGNAGAIGAYLMLAAGALAMMQFKWLRPRT